MEDKRIYELIDTFCLRESLACHDPYDVWMTDFGIRVKQFYNANALLGLLPAAAVTIWDQFLNNGRRLGYKKQEYPTARATAALTLLNGYENTQREPYLRYAQKHLQWLIENSCQGYAGLCWGLGFTWAAGDGLDYDKNTPFSTHTPYVLEALHRYVALTSDKTFVPQIRSIYAFYEQDIQVMYEDEESLATSYGPKKDRLVTNAVSYTLYAYTLLIPYFPEKEGVLRHKIQKLYNFIKTKQLADGSWLYVPDNPDSFIDCFHSCFILKNLYKANKLVPLSDCDVLIDRGYQYVKTHFYSPDQKLFKRFTLSNKPSIIKFDLYDNAEILHLASLLGDTELTKSLSTTLDESFVQGKDIYSVIDIFNSKGNKNTLRWAVMPYLYALSALVGH